MKNKLLFKNHWLEILLVFSILALFTWLRFAHIQDSLLFFGDLGRDFFVLQQWQMTGKPPLLGPQTSALPFNQSAMYFYILYPFYLLLNHSLFSTIIANWFYHVVAFVIGLYVLRKQNNLRRVWLVSWFLIAIQPQYVEQHRYIWNPSFVGVSLLTAYMAFEHLLKKFSYPVLGLFTLTLAAATAFSYSAVPVMIAFVVLALFTLRQHVLKIFLALGASLDLVNLPTIAFEVRHNFVLTRLMLHGEKLTQSGKALNNKLANLDHYVLATPREMLNLVILAAFTLAVVMTLRSKAQSIKKLHTLLEDRFIRAVALFLLTFAILLLLPISLHAHYVFGLIITSFIVIALLPTKYSLSLIVLLAVIWLQPHQLNSYFTPAFRTTDQTLACAQKVCQEVSDPLFVSVQAGYHPYHNGFEFKYVLKEKGCTVYDIETEPDRAEYMAVFSDQSEYQHGKTAYNELTQFGQSEEIQQISCDGQINVHLLRKVSTP